MISKLEPFQTCLSPWCPWSSYRPFLRVFTTAEITPTTARSPRCSVLQGLLLYNITSKPNRSPPPLVFGQYRESLVEFAHPTGAPVNESFPGLPYVLRLAFVGPFRQHISPLANAHCLQKDTLVDGPMNFNTFARPGCRLYKGGEVDVGTEISEPRLCKGADTAVPPNPAQGVDRYRAVAWTVV